MKKRKHLIRLKFIFSIIFLFVLPSLIFAQTTGVTGVVVSADDGIELIGVSVVEKGTTNGVSTDADGRFQIQMKTEKGVLVFSMIGMKTQEISAKNGDVINISLTEDQALLDEVIVTGYSTQKKADLTGAVAVVSINDLKTSADTDPIRALQGRVAGMTVTNDGSPSGTGTIRIRGIGSLQSSQDPLFVIDGVPTTSTLNSLNTNDIESMQVLKDAASASIYGSRAANGVIIITTKKGKNNQKLKVDFLASVTAQYFSSKMKLLDTDQYGKVLVQAALNDGIDPTAYSRNYGYTVTGSGSALRDFSITPGIYSGYLNSTQTMRASNTDWMDEISRTGILQNYDLSLSTGSEKGSTMFSLGYKNNGGILRYTDFSSLSARMNSSYNVHKIITVGENFTVTYTKQVDDPGVMENALKMASIIPVYETDGVTFGGPIGSMPDRQNPVRQLYHNKDNQSTFWRLFGNAYVDIKPWKGFLFRSNFGLDYDSEFRRNLTHTFVSDIIANNTAEVSITNAQDTKWNWSNTVNYNFEIDKKHNISLLGGNELYRQTRVDSYNNIKEFAIETPDYMWPNAGTGTTTVTGNQSGFSLVSFFGKIDYNFMNRYLASFTIRKDGSSRFGKDNRYATFPAVTAGWRISDESFMKGVSGIDDLKLRASWGKTGNQEISNTARYGLYQADYGSDRVTSTAYDINGIGSGLFPSGYRITQTANDNLKWETAEQYNIGVDFTLLNQSIYGNIDAYIKDVTDMLISPAYLGAKGEGGVSWANGPSLRNKGMEFSIGYRKSLNNDLSIDVNGNVDFFRSKVTYLPATATGSYEHTNTENLIGRAYGSRVGYVADGLFQTQDEVDASGQTNARVGGLKFADITKDGEITAADRTWILDPVPAFAYGLNFSLSYKKFDFQMFWQGVHDVDVENVQKYQTDFWSVNDVGANKGSRLLDAWSPTNTSSTIPALTTNNTADEGRFSSYFVENGSYCKLRMLQVGYSIPPSLSKKIAADNARVYVSGQNLLTLKSNGFTAEDPENAAWRYPIPTSFTLGVQVSF
ncbi:TonB-dependent receptor [Dysgonomonas sp. ZJ709]|uniref:SusC/RagA family TonB-linked outer membrane protein n=1 Tax=Dysgonomonas sp. ZJ709 TaxID=2709797 RepID=UPI0013EBE3A6|nr:TonB-dependent receptor [Dysgonomonas sp. ZJ709]